MAGRQLQGSGSELCTWVDFSLRDVERALGFSSDKERLKQELCRTLDLGRAENASHDLIELDMYVYAIMFGMKQEFSSAQHSTLLGIMKRLHANCISTVFDNQSDAQQFFQQMMVQHSVRRPPFSICVFNPNEVKKINEYVLSTYFKHYKLYKYAFTSKVRLNLALSYTGQVETEPEITDEVLSQGNDEIPADRESEYCRVITDSVHLIIVAGHEELSEEELEAEPHLKELINNGLKKLIQQEQVRFS
jgi:hypothetical protein